MALTDKDNRQAFYRMGGKGPRETTPGIAISVSEPFNNLTSLTIALQTATNQAFTTPIVMVTSPAYTLSQLKGGMLLLPDVLPDGVYERYLRLFYTVTGIAPASGRIFAAITTMQPSRLT